MSVQDDLVKAAIGEWIKWGGPRQDVKSVKSGFASDHMESSPTYFGYVHQYWQAIGSDLTGKDSTPWSGAFICFCFKAAGAGNRFPYKSNHSKYCAKIATGKFMGLAIEDPAVTGLAPGDLLWAGRGGDGCRTPPSTYQAAMQELGQIALGKADSFCSHSDIVVDVRNGEVDVIGGNVADAVTKTTYRLNKQGLIADGRRSFIGIIKNRL